jgi:serine/threonine protein kinase
MSEPRPLAPNQLAQLQAIIDEPELPPERYQLLGRLGRGGMGSVFLVRDLLLEREVALKLLSLPETEGELDARLAREARVLASLEHPGIVPVHDLGRLADGRLYYTMKRVEGRTLAEHCRAEQLGLRARIGLLLKLCEALAFAHARGVLHRDLKPANVMVGSFGELLVMDWGLAALTAPAPGGGSADGAAAAGAARAISGALGTPGYMAPEQATGGPVDARADIYAVGGILADLAGEKPPRPLAAIRDRARAAEPAARYPDARALAADLAAWLDDAPVAAYRERAWERLGRALRRHRFVILLLLAFVVVRLAMLFWLRH